MESNSQDKRGTWAQALGSLSISILLVLSVRWLLFEAYVIPSGSMLPTLLINDHIFVNKLAYGIRWPFLSKWIVRYSSVQRGDVVVFRSVQDQDTFMVKRVMGLAGDKIEYDENGSLKVNGKEIAWQELKKRKDYERENAVDFTKIGFLENHELRLEKQKDKSYITVLQKDRTRFAHNVEVPPGYLFMMGDNRDNSSDSRFWGFVPEENLLGTPLFVWLSCESEQIHAIAQCAPEKIRWNRFFHRVQ